MSIDRMYFVAAVGNDDAKALDNSPLYPSEEMAERFVTSWNANSDTVAKYGKARVVLVRVSELIELEEGSFELYNNHNPLV